MSRTPNISVIIPTKNRKPDLLIVFRSLLGQTALPEQIVIVDQSPDDSALGCLQAELDGIRCTMLDYVHDPLLNGCRSRPQPGNGPSERRYLAVSRR
jgi:GT2 family glycosyltransferase